MSDYTKLFERAGARYEAPSLSTEGSCCAAIASRNRRITAAVVGMAVFVAVVWLLRDVASLNRTQAPVVPGGASTRPPVTGPAHYGPDLADAPSMGDSSGRAKGRPHGKKGLVVPLTAIRPGRAPRDDDRPEALLIGSAATRLGP